jgi:hypothetical protein
LISANVSAAQEEKKSTSAMDQQSEAAAVKATESSVLLAKPSAESPPPTPRDLVGAAASRRGVAQRNGGDTPPAKRLKQDGIGAAEEMKVETGGPQHALPSSGARTPATPTIRTESASSKGSLLSDPYFSVLDDARKTPVSVVDRRPSDSPSDLSSASRERRREHSMSPTRYMQHEVPPAPPSTPASEANALNAITLEGVMTPLPYKAVQNADLLLRQQLLADGSATPAPKKPAQPPQQKQPSLVDDFSDWEVGERYKLQRMLGRGSYGEVAQALDLDQGRTDAYVAIKRIPSPFDEELDAIRLFREIHLLRRLRGHECVIQLLDVVQPPTDDLKDFHDLYLVFECK